MGDLLNDQVIILGAGRSITGGSPSAVTITDEHHRVLDWILDAFSALEDPEVYFIGGYRVNEVTNRYPDIRFRFNPDWAVSGSARSLALMSGDSSVATYVCYSDVVFRSPVARRMGAIEADVVLAVDSHWRVRYDGRTHADMDGAEKIRLSDNRVVEVGRHVDVKEAAAEFVGLMRFSATTTMHVYAALTGDQLPMNAGMPELINYLIDEGHSCEVVDIEGDWAHLNAPQDLTRFVLGTKAESLARLRPLLRLGRIGDQVSFGVEEWQRHPERMLDRVREVFAHARLVVRSSAMNEDRWHSSLAGAHTSLLDVPGRDRASVRSAIGEVVGSYSARAPEDQILVQRMLSGVTMSGVVMTRTPTIGAPYYVICFDTSGSTASVTSGTGGSRTVFLLRGEKPRTDFPGELDPLLDAVRELESLVGHDSLDIEFAFTDGGPPHILQVRPIAVTRTGQPVDDAKLAEGLRDSMRYFKQLGRPSAIAKGTTTQLSVMADWNPAEMIGVKPQPLAFSLYRHLITDEGWARQRAEFGYRDVRPHNLIVDFLGHPYVDVRVDLNSFIPATLSEELTERLVDHFLARLRESPQLHDKVEFDVAITCMTLDFERQAGRLRRAGFTKSDVDELRDGLESITRAGIARCSTDAAAIPRIRRRLDTILLGTPAPLERAYLLLEEVRRVSIPIFAHLARNAFIGVALLWSLRDSGVLTNDQVESFMASLKTVPAAMLAHARAVVNGDLPRVDFVGIYGHLRPGSYDITSPCYSDAAKEFLDPLIEQVRLGPVAHKAAEPWPLTTRNTLENALREVGLDLSCHDFETFLHTAIEGREFAKFEFMRGVNAALEAIAEYGAGFGLGREELALIRLEELMTLRGACADDRHHLLIEMARRGRETSFVTQAASLPAYITCQQDFVCFEQQRAEPNFVTLKKIRGPVVTLSGKLSPMADLAGKIVLVRNADPGYDWLFSRNIAGLITAYGGVNSHMAIRAAEFGLPAAIGIGETLFEELMRSRVLSLDCAARQIQQ